MINKVCIVSVFIALPALSNAMTFTRAKALFSHLENSSGYHVQLKLSPELEINAWTSSPYAITITQGLLNFCNDAQIISVMGHELGHIDKQDYRKDKGGYSQEVRADLTGTYYCKKLGYSKKQCMSFMYKIRKAKGEEVGDGVHPGWTIRIKFVKEFE
jgi:predicted Zn-dependent protease